MKTLTSDETEKRLGTAVRQWRVDAGYSQDELAARASISRSAVQNIERGQGSRLTTLIRVLGALGRLDALDALTPRQGPSPMEQLAAQRREQRRTPSRLVGSGAQGASDGGSNPIFC